jgi:amino acid adenylation domain-containing protein
MPQSFDPFAGIELSRTVPATQPQREIWLAMQLGGSEANLAFNLCSSLELDGEVDREILRASWNLLAERHESLRTCFTKDGLTLCIEKTPRIDLKAEDWSPIDREAQLSKRAALLAEEVGEPFDLVTRPGFRATWIDYGKGRSELFLTAHHALCDGYSTGVLLAELCAAYADLAAGRTPSLEPAPRFSDYSVAQNEAMNGEEAAAAEKYWMKALGENPDAVDLPTDFVRPSMRTYGTCRVDSLFPKDHLEDFRAMAGKAGVSLTAAFLSAFGAFLSRLSGQSDFVVGMPAAGQAMPGFGGLVGHCVNTLPLPMRVDPDKSFVDLAGSTKSAILDGLENQVLSFGSLVQKLNLHRDPSRVPLIPVLMNIDTLMKPLKLGNARAKLHSHPRSHEVFELVINGTETEEGMVLETSFNTALLRKETVLCWISDFQQFLRNVSKEPRRAIKEIPALSSKSAELLDGWNRTSFALPEKGTVLSLFEEQARNTPGAVAVRDGSASLTYAELDGRANFLARRLVELGVAPDDIVGVHVRRSVQAMAALLAVWKASAAYIPLDPDYPEDRLSFIVRDSGIRVVITEGSNADAMDIGAGTKLLLDQERGSSDSPPPRSDDPRRVAYVIYTSGSTGKPKGVQVEHRSLLNIIQYSSAEFSISQRDVFVAITSISFDPAGLDLYLPIVNGSQVVIASREDIMDGARLSRLLSSNAATFLISTPGIWQVLVETDWKAGPRFISVCGGEPLSPALSEKILAKGVELWNAYGPTETTIYSTKERIRSGSGSISIGRPVGNTTLRIVDQNNLPVPIGAAGELLIGGIGVARGYLNRPDLSLERFIPDPYSKDPGARLYRTGDVCRFDPEGKVYFLRRNDNQVKIRGFRIELGEIEKALLDIGGIAAAVANVKEFGPSDVRLVGYVVAEGDSLPEAAELKKELGKRLPAYMIPQYIVRLDKLPLTANGKIDRRALPMPQAEGASSVARKEPASPVQKKIAAIWSRLLHVDSIGIDESFFNLGGHSLLAVQMSRSMLEELGVEIPIQTIFQYQTIEGLAACVEAAGLAASGGKGVERASLEELTF